MGRADDLSAFAKLESEFYAGLPKKKFLAGRRRCRKLAEMVVQEFQPGDSFETICANVKEKAKQEYGSVILTMVLASLIGELVRMFVQWWIQKHYHQDLAIRWRSEFFEQARGS
jgi:hypothetical protein